jgi:hypothetical protein
MAHRLLVILFLAATLQAQTLVNRPQSSFLSGQVSPLLSGRMDLAATQHGCRTLTNVHVIDVGAVTRRPGSVYVASAPDTAFLYPFIYNETDAYALEFTDKKLRFYRDTGIVLSGTTPYEVNTPYAEADIDTLQFYQSSDVAYIVSTTGNYSVQKLIRSDHDSWTLTDCNTIFDNGPFRSENTTDISLQISDVNDDIRDPSNWTALHADANLFEPEQVGSFWKIQHVMANQYDHGTFSAAADSNAVVAGIGAAYNFSFTSASFTGTVKIQVSYDHAWTWVDDYTVTNTAAGAVDVNDSDISDYGQNVLLRVSCTALTAGTLTYELSVDSYLHTGLVRIYEYGGPQDVNVAVWDRCGIADANTTRWAEGAWSDYRGYPTAVGGHFGRVVYSRNLTAWFTGIEDYENFGNYFSADDEAFTWTASLAEQNPIRWIVGGRTQNIVLGTLGKVMELRSMDELSGFTPTNPAKVTSASAVSCSAVFPALADTAILFADRTGRHIHELIYDSGEETIISPDLTQIAGPILGTSNLAQIAFQESPWPTLWCVRGDGKMATCYYSRPYQIAAWSVQDTPDGLYKSVVVLPTSGGLDRVWTVVDRTIGSATVHCVEYFSDIDVDTGVRFVDTSLSWDGGEPPTTSNISIITKASPGKVTLTVWPTHVVAGVTTNLADGDNVRITGAEGMTEINDTVFVVDDRNVNAKTLTLDSTGNADYDTTDFTTYTGGGILTWVESSFAGLDHLEGEEVSVIADGAYVGDYTVDANTVTLDDYYNEVYIGLPYTSTVTPLEVDLIGQAGTTQFAFKRIVRLLLSVYETAGLKYGINSGALKSVPWPAGSGIASPATKHTGTYIVGFPSGPQQEATYTIVQNEPYAMTLRTTVPQLELGQ